MEFLNGILAKFSGHKLESSQLVFLSGALSSFSILRNALREKYGFLLNPPVEGTVNGMEQKTRVL
jgi:hypothetical protein